MRSRRCLARLFVATFTAVAIIGGSTLTVSPAHAATTEKVRWGFFGGPGTKTTDRAATFGKYLGLPISDVLDFAPESSWTGHTGLVESSWLLAAHGSSPYRLTYSVAMFPIGESQGLERCATGEFNGYWKKLGTNLVAVGKPNTVLRLGWEFNGTWYRWSAVNRPATYIKCFRQIVAAMRTTSGQQFKFMWSPNVSYAPMPAEQAYPGDDVVDYVGLSAYDMSWGYYPAPSGMTLLDARRKAWEVLLRGEHGLLFWRDFSLAHGKKMALPEWGQTQRGDGHGGGDNPYYAQKMMQFIADPANNVAYNVYFNFDAGTTYHDVLRVGTVFPQAAKKLQELGRAWTAANSV